MKWGIKSDLMIDGFKQKIYCWYDFHSLYINGLWWAPGGSLHRNNFIIALRHRNCFFKNVEHLKKNLHIVWVWFMSMPRCRNKVWDLKKLKKERYEAFPDNSSECRICVYFTTGVACGRWGDSSAKVKKCVRRGLLLLFVASESRRLPRRWLAKSQLLLVPC